MGVTKYNQCPVQCWCRGVTAWPRCPSSWMSPATSAAPPRHRRSCAARHLAEKLGTSPATTAGTAQLAGSLHRARGRQQSRSVLQCRHTPVLVVNTNSSLYSSDNAR